MPSFSSNTVVDRKRSHPAPLDALMGFGAERGPRQPKAHTAPRPGQSFDDSVVARPFVLP